MRKELYHVHEKAPAGMSCDIRQRKACILVNPAQSCLAEEGSAAAPEGRSREVNAKCIDSLKFQGLDARSIQQGEAAPEARSRCGYNT
jgi:hypothetical protein